MEVIVPDDQLSLAIGRKGQNVRLAGKLSKWKLDVSSEQDYEKRLRESRRSLRRVEGLGDLRAELLLADGYKSAAELATSDPTEISQVVDCTPEEAQAYVASAASAAEVERVERMVLRLATAVSEAAAALKPPAEEEAAPESEQASEEPVGAEPIAAGTEVES
jgi:N utilization substance protein A